MKIGLKLWSNNTDAYLEEAKRLYKEGWFDYIELYVVPNTLETIQKWKGLSIPFTLHAPHFAHGVNLAKKENKKINIEAFKEVNEFFNELNAEYTVVHSGIQGTIDESIRQLNIIKPKKMLIENKPFIAPLGEHQECRGATIEEIRQVIDEVGCGFCLDIGHAICTANSLNLKPYKYLSEFNSLNPRAYHLSDNFIYSEIDGHKHLGHGNYDFGKILGMINTDKNIAIETNKISKISLDDFIDDIKYIRGL